MSCQAAPWNENGKSFWVPNHVLVCSTSDGTVLLDIRRNKYFAISCEEAQAASLVANGWPVNQGARINEHHLDRNHAANLGTTLLEAGLLTAEPPAGDPINQTSIDLNGTLISVGEEIEAQVIVRPSEVAKFLLAYSSVRYSLRFCSFESIVEDVRARKEQTRQLNENYDIDALCALVCLFRRLRSYVFAAEGQCLVHALSLVRFLSMHHIYATWVIGVMVRPWGAHSWAQVGSMLLDTDPSKVCEYRPILVI